MPNINEFINFDPNNNIHLQQLNGIKPCNRCEKDSEVYYWNEDSLEMTWTCPDGHENSYRIK